MKKIYLAIFVILSTTSFFTQAQDLNTISGTGFNIATGATPTNAPLGGVVMGLQNQYDTNYKWQLVNVAGTDNYYLRKYIFGWTGYYNIWHSGNFDPDTYLDRSVSSIGNSGTADTFLNGYTFAYATSGTPWNGSLISYGGFGAMYDTQFSSDYGPSGGKHISFRTRNGDGPAHWNSWYELWNSGNLNRNDVDFAAQTVNCTNVYAAGNLWAKEIKVAVTNPWPDYVFKPKYVLQPLAEVKSFIAKNHRLPGMPSANEVTKNGINLAETVRLQTQKIEELTLYLIEKDKEINDLKQQKSISQTQQNQIDELRKQVETLIKKKS